MTICRAARIATLITTTETAIELGLPQEYAMLEVLKACNERWGLYTGVTQPKMFSRQQLMQPAQERRRAAHNLCVSPESMDRLASLCNH